MQPTPLTPEKARQMAISVRRLAELGDTKIQTRETEAEARGLAEFLRKATLDHADELIACWHACVFEYEPFLKAMNGVMHRVSSLNAQRQAEAQKAALVAKATEAPAETPAPDSTPAQIITPDFTKAQA